MRKDTLVFKRGKETVIVVPHGDKIKITMVLDSPEATNDQVHKESQTFRRYKRTINSLRKTNEDKIDWHKEMGKPYNGNVSGPSRSITYSQYGNFTGVPIR